MLASIWHHLARKLRRLHRLCLRLPCFTCTARGLSRTRTSTISSHKSHSWSAAATRICQGYVSGGRSDLLSRTFAVAFPKAATASTIHASRRQLSVARLQAVDGSAAQIASLAMAMTEIISCTAGCGCALLNDFIALQGVARSRARSRCRRCCGCYRSRGSGDFCASIIDGGRNHCGIVCRCRCACGLGAGGSSEGLRRGDFGQLPRALVGASAPPFACDCSRSLHGRL